MRVLDDLSTGRRENLAPSVTLLQGDVADPQLAMQAMRGVDGCFHLAAIASVQRANEAWLQTHRANQTGAITIFDAARAAGRVPVVYASSAAVYGDLGGAVAREDMPCRPQTAYGADKRGCELHAAVALGVHNVSTVGLRFFNVYGPRQDPHSPYSGVISIFAQRLAADEEVVLHGDGGQSRDFIAVSDVVAHLAAAMAHAQAAPCADLFNVCTGQETSIAALLEVMAQAAARPLRRRFGPARPGDIRRSLGDPARAIAALGVRAQTPLARGLRDLLDLLVR